jgi:hypothetical protein
MSASELYYNPAKPSAFSTMAKVTAVVPTTNKSEFRACLVLQDAYTQHRPIRKRFLSNPYNVTNLMDVWECDLLRVHFLAKYNDMHRYILSLIDVLSKYIDLVPVKTKSGPSIALSFRSKFHDDDSRRPLWVRTYKGKEFLYKHFQEMLLH